MSRIALSNTGDWELKFDEQDVRGYEALDANGNHIGEVDTMLVNTDESRVDAIVLDDGKEYPARDISIGDGVVYLTTIVPDDVSESVTVYDDYGHVIERANVDAKPYDACVDDFRAHYQTAYASTGNDFDMYDPAYRFGHDTAHDGNYRNRTYNEAETDLERRYTEQYPNSRYDDVRDAVRYSYANARGDRT